MTLDTDSGKIAIQDELGITADAEVLAGLNDTQTVQVTLQVSESDDSGPSIVFQAGPVSNAKPAATISPYVRSLASLGNTPMHYQM